MAAVRVIPTLNSLENRTGKLDLVGSGLPGEQF